MLRFFEPEANTRWLVAGAHQTPQLKADAVSPAESPAVAVRRSSSLPAKANYLVKHQWHPSLFPMVSDVNVTASPSPDASSAADSLKNASSAGGGGGGVISWQDAGVFRRQASDPFLEMFQGGRSSSLAADRTARSIKLKHVHELDESNKMADNKRQRSSGDEKLYFLPSFDHPSSKTRVTINQTTKEPAKNQKLGDKITALQQLVSPFGKTDTASVLQEATVYIKALHEQLAFQILSRSRFETNSPGSIQGKRGGGQSKLYDWGLCIVPVSPAIISFANQECPNYSTGELINQIN